MERRRYDLQSVMDGIAKTTLHGGAIYKHLASNAPARNTKTQETTLASARPKRCPNRRSGGAILRSPATNAQKSVPHQKTMKCTKSSSPALNRSGDKAMASTASYGEIRRALIAQATIPPNTGARPWRQSNTKMRETTRSDHADGEPRRYPGGDPGIPGRQNPKPPTGLHPTGATMDPSRVEVAKSTCFPPLVKQGVCHG